MTRTKTLLSGILVCLASCAAPDSEPAMEEEAAPMLNTLTEEERAEGWTLLFDGKSLDQWRGFRSQEVPEGWEVNDDSIHYTGKVRAGDILTREQYGNFDLRLEWKVLEAGNSGIFFRASEEYESLWYTGPEMQVLDDAGHRDGAKRETSAGANYALHPPSQDVVRKAGEWNQVGIVANGNHVEHWMNGEKIVEYELRSEDWKQKVAASKFKDLPHYGLMDAGHIVLQDHSDPVWFRNIKIRKLD